KEEWRLIEWMSGGSSSGRADEWKSGRVRTGSSARPFVRSSIRPFFHSIPLAVQRPAIVGVPAFDEGALADEPHGRHGAAVEERQQEAALLVGAEGRGHLQEPLFQRRGRRLRLPGIALRL